MSPPFRRRRRPSRPAATVVAVALAAAVVFALLIGGVLSEGKGSASYLRAVDRSYAAELRPLIESSNALGIELRTEVGAIAGQTRPAAQAELDSLVRRARAISDRAATLATPAPPGGVGQVVASVCSDRAAGVAGLRTAVDGLLQMTPLPVEGSGGVSAAQVAPAPPAVSPAAAAAALTATEHSVAAADRHYAAARHTLRRDPGAAALPPSSWSAAGPLFGTGGLVAALEASSTLAAVQKLELLDDALAVTPAPVPPSGSGPPQKVVPPTHHLSLTVVVAEKGNVPARQVPVTAQVAPQGGAAGTSKSVTVSVQAGGSLSLTLGPFPVTPGTTYTVTMNLQAPSGEVAGSATTDSFVVKVAPPTPPPTTTTTTTSTTSTTAPTAPTTKAAAAGTTG